MSELDVSREDSGPQLFEKSSDGTIIKKARDLQHPDDHGTEDIAFIPRLKGPVWIIVMFSVLSSTFLFALDNTIVADVQPKIIETFGQVSKLPWVSVGGALGGVCLSLAWGKLYGQFDCKTLFVTSVVIFVLGSALCAAAPSMNIFIVGRVFAGLGGSGLYIGAISIIAAFTSVSERPLYMSFLGATWSGATVLGPIIGGAFGDSKATWRWAFYINLCVAAAATPVYLFLLPPHTPLSRPATVRERIKRLDLLGSTLFVGCTISLVMAICFGGGVYTWSSKETIALFVGAGVFGIIFVLQQASSFLTTEEDRLFPVQFLHSSEFCILFAQVAMAIPCLYIPIYFIPLFFQFVHGDTALESAVRLLPFICVAITGAIITGVFLPKTIYMPWFLAGGILATIGGALLHSITMDSSTPTIYGYSAILAFGAGLFLQAPFSVAQAKVTPKLVPAAIAFISCSQLSSIPFTLAIANSIFINRAVAKIGTILPGIPIENLLGAGASVDAAVLHGLDIADFTNALRAVVASIGDVYVVVTTAAAFTVILSIFMKRENVFKSL